MLKDLLYALSLGSSIIFSICFSTYIGHLIDKMFSSSPIFLVLGIFSGVIFSFLILFRKVK